MESAFAQCPAVAAKITFDTDQREVTVDYNPLWLERQKMTGPRMGGMEGGMKRCAGLWNWISGCMSMRRRR